MFGACKSFRVWWIAGAVSLTWIRRGFQSWIYFGFLRIWDILIWRGEQILRLIHMDSVGIRLTKLCIDGRGFPICTQVHWQLLSICCHVPNADKRRGHWEARTLHCGRGLTWKTGLIQGTRVQITGFQRGVSQEWHSAGVLSALHSTGEWQNWAREALSLGHCGWAEVGRRNGIENQS